MKKLSFILMVLLFIGCSPFQDQNIHSKKDKDVHESLTSKQEGHDLVNYPFGQPQSSTVKNYRWANLEGQKKETARKKARMRMSKALGASAIITPIIKKGMDEHSNKSADEIISNIQGHLNKWQGREETFLIEQVTASAIMSAICKNYTLKSNLEKCWNEKWNSKKIQMLNYATSLFVKNANPNADLIAYNLEKLEGSISDETLEHYASQTIASSKAWFSSDKLCATCSSANAPGNVDRKAQLVQQGISDLKKYVN